MASDGAPPIEDGWLTIYLYVLPLTAVLFVIVFGLGLFIFWLLGLGARAALYASRNAHPINPEEDID